MVKRLITDTDKRIFALALPALGSLIAEPVMLLADTAFVGHLGVLPLAGLGIASAVLATAVGLCVFLAYGTTGAVARALGAGRKDIALASGIDGMWFALALGVLLAGVGYPSAEWLVTVLGATNESTPFAVTYLHYSLPGIPAMLLVFATTGILRGFQDTTTPLMVTTAGIILNVPLNYVLIYPMGMGIAGSGLGTAISQVAMAFALVWIVLRRVNTQRVRFTPRLGGLIEVAHASVWLFLRTVLLRVAVLATLYVAASQGDVNVAAHQIVLNLFNLTAYILDALAIAAQATIGLELGKTDKRRVRELYSRLTVWTLLSGLVLTVLLLVSMPFVPGWFTPDGAVQQSIVGALIVIAIFQPLGSMAFLLDGVLIGAGDNRFLAIASVASLVVYLPMLVWVYSAHLQGVWGLVWIWAAYSIGFLGSRTVILGIRAHGDRWMRLATA